MSSAKNLIKKIAEWSLHPSLYRRLAGLYYNLGRSLTDLRWQYSWAGYRNRRRIHRLHNAYSGRRCFVIGNGPSLAQTDLSRLTGEITIGCNNLFLMFDKMGYLPTFYTVEDNLVAEDRAEEINRIRGTTKILPRDLSYCLSRDSDTIYINFLRRYPGFPKFSNRFDKVVYWGGTVTHLNLQLAYYIGCREVYLVGVDHSYEVSPDVQDTVIVSKSADESHFHPDYFGPGYRYHHPRVERMEKAYVAAREFAAQNNMTIFNATIGGKLEVFPRVCYEDITGEQMTGKS
ncbi:hypothetical protein ES707_22915 [subsurface metagenome]